MEDIILHFSKKIIFLSFKNASFSTLKSIAAGSFGTCGGIGSTTGGSATGGVGITGVSGPLELSADDGFFSQLTLPIASFDSLKANYKPTEGNSTIEKAVFQLYYQMLMLLLSYPY